MKISEVRNRWETIKSKYTYFETPATPEAVVTIPSNPDDLIDTELDRCLVSFGSWRSYITAQLASVESELSILEEAFQIRLGEQIAELESSAPKKMLKESLHGKAVMENTEIRELFLAVSDLRAEKMLLLRQYSFFDGQFETISRVVTRRGQDRVRAV